jgi:hypothetical protein
MRLLRGCFCGQGIEPKSRDPLQVTAETADGKWQVWFAHAECFKERLVDPPDMPGFVDPAHF